jgi:tRNA (cmo5U34)-methyltransferase
LTGEEWRERDRAEEWPAVRAELPHAPDAEALLFEHLISEPPASVLDLGTGDGHLIAQVRSRWPQAAAIGLDLSSVLIDLARDRFKDEAHLRFEVHDLMDALPFERHQFDLVLSALAMHHLPDERKKQLLAEVFELLLSGGRFFNLDVAASATPQLHALNQRLFSLDARDQDRSDQPARLEDQLTWLRGAGFVAVDCHWKWLELTLVGARKPEVRER